MNHLPQGIDARPTPQAESRRTTRLAFVTTVAAILLAHLFLYFALTTR